MKVTFIIAGINKSLGMEWMTEGLQNKGLQMEFVLLNDKTTPFEDFLKANAIPVRRVHFNSLKQLPLITLKLFFRFVLNKPDIVHTHLPAANLSGLLAAKLAGIRKRIITRHHSTYHHKYFPKAVKQDHVINWLATHIVAPSKNVRDILINKEKVQPEKVHLIHHGFMLEYFSNQDQNVDALRQKYLPTEYQAFPVIGVVARYLELKGIQYIIQSFQAIRKTYPDAFLLLANAQGPYEPEIKKYLAQLPVSSYVEIPFEENIASLYQLMDVYVHVPIDAEIEAFGQTYIEALAAGIPSVFTLSGVAHEFIKHEHNALVVPYQDSLSIEFAIKRIVDYPDWSQKLVANGREDVQKFSLEQMISKLSGLYLR